MNSSLQTLLGASQNAMGRLPLPIQRVFQSPRTQTLIAALVAFRVLGSINKTLSRYAQNNWVRDSWNSTNELVVITGGCSGIGKKIMEDLAKLNTKVIILDLHEPDFELPLGVNFYQCDVTSRSSIKSVAEKIRQNHGDATVLVNNAGVANPGSILDKSDEKIRSTLEVNTLSHFWTVKEFLPAMVKRNHGHIITIASIASFMALGNAVDYSCSKAAALAFHEGLNQELKHWYNAKRVRTSVIHPYFVKTPMVEKAARESGGRMPRGAITPDEVSAAVVKQIITQSGGQILVPSSYTLVSMIRSFPNWIQEGIRDRGSRGGQRNRKAH